MLPSGDGRSLRRPSAPVKATLHGAATAAPTPDRTTPPDRAPRAAPCSVHVGRPSQLSGETGSAGAAGAVQHVAAASGSLRSPVRAIRTAPRGANPTRGYVFGGCPACRRSQDRQGRTGGALWAAARACRSGHSGETVADRFERRPGLPQLDRAVVIFVATVRIVHHRRIGLKGCKLLRGIYS
jgi:hypothetical protein